MDNPLGDKASGETVVYSPVHCMQRDLMVWPKALYYIHASSNAMTKVPLYVPLFSVEHVSQLSLIKFSELESSKRQSVIGSCWHVACHY